MILGPLLSLVATTYWVLTANPDRVPSQSPFVYLSAASATVIVSITTTYEAFDLQFAPDLTGFALVDGVLLAIALDLVFLLFGSFVLAPLLLVAWMFFDAQRSAMRDFWAYWTGESGLFPALVFFAIALARLLAPEFSAAEGTKVSWEMTWDQLLSASVAGMVAWASMVMVITVGIINTSYMLLVQPGLYWARAVDDRRWRLIACHVAWITLLVLAINRT